MKKKIVWGVVLIVVVVLVVLLDKDKSPAEGNTFRIGVSQTLTGPAAYYGESNKRGVDLAMKELKEKYPSINFEVYHSDNQYSPKVSVDTYRQLRLEKNIDAIITHSSPSSIAIAPLAQEDNFLQIAVSASAKSYSTPDDLSFRTSLGTDKEVGVMLEYIKENCDGSINILGMNNEIGVSISESMKKSVVNSGIKIPLYEMFPVETTDFRSLILKYKQQTNVKCLYFPALASHAVNFLKQADELQFDPKLLSFRTMEDPVILKSGQLAENLIFTSGFDPNSSKKETVNFVEKFKGEYGMTPDIYSAEGYAATMLIADSFAKCSNDKECIFNYLSGLKNHPTILGDITFDNNGDVDYDYFVSEIKDGKMVRIK
jgi:branched-chain amino acid transport system substrate-binding protein